jgi:hypothetical protein
MSFSWLFLGGVVSTRARFRFTNQGQCAVNSVRRSRILQRTANYLLTVCPTPGGKRKVQRINYILKRRATRYVAAVEEEWLYPERCVYSTDWKSLEDDWFLLPNLWKIPFTTGIFGSSMRGRVWGFDEYGRQPGSRFYEDKVLREKEWVTKRTCEKGMGQEESGKVCRARLRSLSWRRPVSRQDDGRVPSRRRTCLLML